MRYIILALVALLSSSANAADYSKEYNWKVIRVIDGDTMSINTTFMTDLRWYVRVRGVDTPEKRTPKCASEKELAIKATEFTTKLIAESTHILFKKVNHDKYGGRLVADVYVDGVLLSDALVAAGYGYKYDGGRKQSWCTINNK